MAIYRGNGGAGDANNDATINEIQTLLSATQFAKNYAEEWAVKAEDSLVSTEAGGNGVDDYSALHYASKAAAYDAAYQAYLAAAELARDEAEIAQIAAELAESNAATSETNAATSESNASTSEINAATSAANAANSATSASASESNAATSATNAASSETNASSFASAALVSANNAAASESSALTYSNSAATSASNASTSEINAANSASAALNSENNAATSATSASNSATSASTSASSASSSASAASASESNASTSETNAASSESAAATSASNAATSETNASTSASNAAASASSASTSATNASTSASNAATSESNAAASATAAANSFDSFDDRYLGEKASAPTVDNDGDALLTGALYWNTTTNSLFIWDGSAWVAGVTAGSGFLPLVGGTLTGGLTVPSLAVTNNATVGGTLTVTNQITANDSVVIEGDLTVNGTVDGRDVAADGSKLDGIESGATADQTASEILTLIKTVDGSGSGLNADTLDGLQASAFALENGGYINNGNYGGYIHLNDYDDGEGANTGIRSYVRDGVWNIHKDVSETNPIEIRVENQKVWTSGNDGSGSGLDADTLDGLQGADLAKVSYKQTAATLANNTTLDSGFYTTSDGLGLGLPTGWKHIINMHHDDNNGFNAQISVDLSSATHLHWRGANGGTWGSWNKIWHEGNDGSGSGLDADTLDGQQGTYYLDYNNLTNVPSVSSFPSGTKMLFQQTAAPTGWTKDTTHDNKALRVVSGTAGSGGSVAFTSAFTSKAVSGSISNTTAGGTVGNHTLNTTRMPSHNHSYSRANSTHVVNTTKSGTATYKSPRQNATSGSAGGNGAHNHSFTGTAHNHTFTGTAIDMSVQYVDLIIATKD